MSDIYSTISNNISMVINAKFIALTVPTLRKVQSHSLINLELQTALERIAATRIALLVFFAIVATV
jgi:hypothetical protein